ncbi:MAG: LysR family transcriptional regulator substrate-binding protein, partial [Actinomycetota bacterium]
LLVVAPEGHPLAERDEVSLVDLAEHELLLGPPGTALRNELDAEAAAAGVTLRPQAELDGIRLIASLTFEGFGASILPATAVPGWLQGRWRRVTVPELTPRTVGLGRRRRGLPSTPARALADVLRWVVDEQGRRQPGLHLSSERE